MRERDIFDAALAITNPAERSVYLTEVCCGNPELREHIEGLIMHVEQLGSFLEPPASSPVATTHEPPTERPGTMIGPYKLLQQIGEGGMGIVYLAEQEQPVRRKVAIKIIKPGMDSTQVIARFEAERQALALMDHLNIARVLDAGATATGHPYFVMELVHGVPITRYCDDNRLTPRERLELFIPVCQAIQHAHQKGIIHRDIKPSNVMVCLYDGKPVSKVIDFGVAKAIEQRLTERTLFTQYGTIVGTFEYMAPEQAELSQLGVDTRSDLYALGVLLYELLTGTTPLEHKRLQEAAFNEILRLIKEEEPPRPSRRLSSSGAALATISQQRRTEPAKLTKLVRGELDWIVMKCLEKDRTRRYETASGLARDLQHYLADEPVEACPPSAGYRLRKFARKYRMPVIVAAAFAVVLVVGALVSAWQAVRAKQAEAEAVVQREHATAAELAATAKGRETEAARQQLWHSLYASNMQLAQLRWRENSFREARALLEEAPPELRGWEWDYLKRLFRGGYPTLYGHTGGVLSVAFSPNGQLLATGGEDGTAKVWDARTGQELFTFKGRAAVNSVAFSPDGQRLSAASGGTAQIWDARTGIELLTIGRTIGPVWSVAFSPDGLRLATGSGDIAGGLEGRTQVWDASTGRELLTIQNHTGPVLSVAFSPDSMHLATGSQGRTGKVWDSRTGHEILSFEVHTGPVWSVAFSPDGLRLATGSGDTTRDVDGSAQLWDASTGRELLTIQNHTGPVVSVAFSPDGLRLLSGSTGETAQLWDARTGKDLACFKGHTGWITSVAFSPDGQRLAAGSWDRTAIIWDARGEQEPVTIRAHPRGLSEVVLKRTAGGVSDVAFSPDGQRLATASGTWLSRGDGSAKVWDANTGHELLSLKGYTGPATSVAFSLDGQRLATGSEDGTAKIWDAKSGDEILSLKGHIARVRTVAFSPDGQRLATASWDKTAKVWDARTGQKLLCLNGHKGGVNRLAFSPDGQRLATASYDKTAKVWDANTGRELLTVDWITGQVGGVAFSPDGERLAISSFNGPAGIWDVRSGEKLLTLRGRHMRLDGVAFSPDGQRLATGSDEGAVIWDARTGQEILTLKGHTGSVLSVAFSADGQRLATGSGDRTAKVWHAPRGPEPLYLKGHTGWVWSVGFSPDGQRLATGSGDGTAKVWDAKTAENLFTLKAHRGPILCVAFSPEGECLATASDDRTAKLWDMFTGGELVTLKGLPGAVECMAFSPDGKRLAVGGRDQRFAKEGLAIGRFDQSSGKGTVKIWDTGTSKELITLEGHSGEVRSVVWRPDGQCLATTGWDGAIKVWDVRSGQPLPADAGNFVLLGRDPALSPDGGRLARIDGNVVYLHEVRRPLGRAELSGTEKGGQ
jgi:WD40 repeat protein/serine/threonine protein kinase